MKKSILLFAAATLMMVSCKKETIEPTPEPAPIVAVTTVPLNLYVYSHDNLMGYSGYDFKVVVKSLTESIDSVNVTYANFDDGNYIYATLQCSVDTSKTYTLDIYDSNTNAFLLTVPLNFHWEDYMLAYTDNASGLITGEVNNHPTIFSATQAHVELSIGK